MSVKGLDQIQANIREEFESLKGRRAERAASEIARRIRAVSDTMVPIDTSNLVNSGYAPIITHGGASVTATIGYTADYAKWVHNMPGKLKGKPRAHFGVTGAGMEFGGGSLSGNYWDPHGEPQFLLKAVKEVKPEAVEIAESAFKQE